MDAVDRASEDAAPLEVADSANLFTRAIANSAPTLDPGGSQIGVPVLVKNTLIGAFGIWRNSAPLDELDLAYVTQFARQASWAIENARLLRQLRQSEEQYRSLFDACLDVVYISTPGGLFLDVTRPA